MLEIIVRTIGVVTVEPQRLFDMFIYIRYTILPWTVSYSDAHPTEWENLSSGFPTGEDSKRPVQLQKLARVLKVLM